MIRSMTGCGEAVVDAAAGGCRVELRSVNNRSFKFSFRGPDGLRGLEPRAEATVKARVRRGTVQMDLDLSGPAAPAERRLDVAQLGAYLDQLEAFCADRDIPVPRAIDGLLVLPGVFVDAPPDPGAVDRCWRVVEPALAAALDRLDAMRQAEGAALAADLRKGCTEIAALAATINARVPRMLEEHRARLADRVMRLLEPQGVALAPADLAREVALIAERSDIAEELVRLDSHVGQFLQLLETEAPGRQLDFLAQELAREANTIAAKATDVEVTRAVVELKTRVERLREQVQNVE